MHVQTPRPLTSGDRVGVTAPSCGVEEAMRPRLDVAINVVRPRGYDVVIGDCMDGTGRVSASAPQRAAELRDDGETRIDRRDELPPLAPEAALVA